MRPGESRTPACDTLPKILRRSAALWGDRVYMRQKNFGIWQRYTWSDVYRQVRAVSMGLVKLGLKKGDTVAIIGENTPELFWADFGALCAGGKVVCLYPDMTPDEMLFVLRHSDALFLIAEDQEQVDKYLEIRSQVQAIRKVVYWNGKGMWQYKKDFLMAYTDLQELGRQHHAGNPALFEENIDSGCSADIALLSYTSGTTGTPKGVILTHHYLLDHAHRVLGANRLKPFTQYLSYLSPAWVTEHFFATTGLLLPFTYNFPEEPETVLANIREIGAEALVFGPRQWESLAATVQFKMNGAGALRRWIYDVGLKAGMSIARERITGVRAGRGWRILHPFAERFVLGPIRDNLGIKKAYFTLTGGAPTAPEIFNFFHALGVRLRNIYGSTEMGLYTQHSGDRFDPSTMGQWYTVAEGLGPPLEWSIDEDGGMLVRGGSGFAGYYKDPEATRAAQKNGWFVTGDAIRMLSNGELVFLDRVKDLKRLSSGHPFPPQYIETRLRFSPYIKDAMIIGDEKKDYVSVFIIIDGENVGRWAEQFGIAYASFTDLSQKTEVCTLVRKEIDRVNQFLDEASRVRRFVNLSKELDPDEAELTRTRKLRRGLLEKRYSALIDAMYAGEESFEMEVQVKYRDGRKGVMKSPMRINTVEPVHA